MRYRYTAYYRIESNRCCRTPERVWYCGGMIWVSMPAPTRIVVADAVTPGDKEGGGPRIYAAQLQISPGGVILCTPGDKSMVCQRRRKLPPGCRILWGVSYIVYVSYIVSDTVYCCGGCVILCTPGDKSMTCQRRRKLPPGGVVYCGGGCLIFCVRVFILCQIR